MYLSKKEKLEIQNPIRNKILIIGPGNTGKTSIFNVLANKPFNPSQGPTIGVDIFIMASEDGRFKFLFYDTSGVKSFLKITQTNYRGTDMFIFVFRVDDRETFERLENYIGYVNENCERDTKNLLIGNMSDSPNREVSIDEAEKWAIDHNMAYLDFSAKNELRATLLSKITEVVEIQHSINN